MANKEKYKKQEKDKKRLETLRTFMSSFTLTVAAVVTVAIIIPKSPIAEIENVSAFQNEIVYQVSVTDEEQAIDLSSLKIVLDGPLEYYAYPLALGLNVGVFEGLTPNTGYQLEVYGNKGFGDEKLAAMRVETKAGSNGAIVSYELVEAQEFSYHYEVNILYNDLENLYSEVNLYYAYVYMDEEPQFYDMVPITQTNQTIELFDVPGENASVHLYLEAMTELGDLIILDELTFYVPFKLSTYLYLDQKSSSNLHFQFYEDYYFKENVTYKAEIYFGHMLIDEKVIEISEAEMHHEGGGFEFTGLKKDRVYRVVVSSTYINPYTKVEETVVLHEEEHATLADYHIEYEITEYDTYFEVYIYLEDPNHYFQVPYYTIYELVDGYMMYYEENMYDFTPDIDSKSVTFTIDYPDLENYQLIIAVRNQNDYTINHIVIDRIIEE